MYLYRVTTGSGHEVEIHPTVPGTTKHPDFLVHGSDPFYLEAVRVGRDPETTGGDRRLSDVETILDGAKIDGLTLDASWHDVGPSPISSTTLRKKLLGWVEGIDRDLLRLQFAANTPRRELPVFEFKENGWHLTFTPVPVGGVGRPLIGMRGPGRAVMVDNRTGLRRVLDSKTNRYGTGLPHPLVTGVLANTDYTTRNYDIEPVLYGEHSRPPQQVSDPAELREDGHWRTRRGWRRGHNPNVVTASDLTVFSMGKVVPRLWTTLEPNTRRVGPFTWADSTDVSQVDVPESSASPDRESLGIEEDWCTGETDFET
jgi:hypothetical protein